LFKHQDENESRLDLTDIVPFRHSEPDAMESTDSLLRLANNDNTRYSFDDPLRDSIDDYRPSIDEASSSGHSGAHLVIGRGRSVSDAGPSIGTRLNATTSNFFGGHALTQSSSLAPARLGTETLAPTPPRNSSGHRHAASTPNALLPPQPAANRSRSSTLRSIFTRNGSSASLSLNPGAGGPTGISPYGQAGGSLTRLATGSSASVASLSIGAPIAHSAGKLVLDFFSRRWYPS